MKSGKGRFKIIPACHLILLRNGRVLLLRRHNTGYEDGNYSVVAGHVDGNETIRCAMAREAKEEAGIVLSPESLQVAHVMHRKKSDEERIDFFLAAKDWKNEPRITEPDKCDDLRWFELGNLPQNTIPYVRHAIGCIRKGIFYSEFGW